MRARWSEVTPACAVRTCSALSACRRSARKRRGAALGALARARARGGHAVCSRVALKDAVSQMASSYASPHGAKPRPAVSHTFHFLPQYLRRILKVRLSRPRVTATRTRQAPPKLRANRAPACACTLCSGGKWTWSSPYGRCCTSAFRPPSCACVGAQRAVFASVWH